MAKDYLEKAFDSDEDVKNELIQFFLSKFHTFFEFGIITLKVLEQPVQKFS